MANKHMKRCPASLVIRKILIKTTMGYHSIHMGMARRKKVDNNNCW